MEPILETIGQRLRALRITHNLTIPQVSEKTGLSKGNLSSIETDKNKPSANALILLAELYGVSADWILFGEKAEKANEVSFSVSSLELAHFFSRINEIWENGDERKKAWVMVQLERAFPEVKDK